MLEKYGSCWDAPDERDFSAEGIFGVLEEKEIPKEKNLFAETSYNPKNQGNSVKCTAYAIEGAHEVMNREEHGDVTFDADVLWNNMVRDGLTSKSGASLQSALDSLSKYGSWQDSKKYPIVGYARLQKNHQSIKSFIARGHTIYTGSVVTDTNFKEAKKTGVFPGVSGQRKTGHAFFIGGYRDGYYIAMNSYNGWGKYGNGTFLIPENVIDQLYSMYILYDAIDLRMIFDDVSEKDWAAKEIEWAKEKGIMTGEKSGGKEMFFPDRPLSRREAAVLLYRLHAKK